MMVHRDEHLERLFDAARSQEVRQAPSFAQIIARRRERRRGPRSGLVVAVVTVLLTAVAVWRYAAPNGSQLDFAFTPGEMNVPTDFLLDMMPVPRAGEIPRIGASDWYPLPLSGDSGPDTRRTP